jgi:hypothetical protein
MLGLVCESSFLKELLFSGGKHELRTAGATLQVLVGKLHWNPPIEIQGSQH